MGQRTLVVVSGPPGSGKTQLAHTLAAAIGCPAISRDEIKEGMVHARGSGFSPKAGDELTRRTYPLFFDIVRRLLEPLSSVATFRIIRCVVADDVARERRLRRMPVPTRAAHADAQWLYRPASRFDPISLVMPTLVVDTRDGYAPALPKIVRFVNGG